MTTPARHDLDELLAAWAHARRLPGADAERICQAIVPAVPALEATWWTELNSRVTQVITRTTATPGPALAALGA
jgi:hypothetical protein